MAKGPLESVLILADVHRPYHDPKAWKLVLKVGKALKPDRIIVNGDYVDNYSISSHSRDPRRADRLLWEMDDARKGLNELDALGAKFKDFIGGNHENWLFRYLSDKAPELFGVVDIPSLLGLTQRGWSYTPYKKHKRLGKLYATHDVGVAGRYSVYAALDAYQHSVITGHSHRLSYVVEGNAIGEYKLSAAFGWLGDVNAIDYMNEAKARKNWPLGFGWGYLHKNGIAFLQPVPIVHYSCVVAGHYFKV